MAFAGVTGREGVLEPGFGVVVLAGFPRAEKGDVATRVFQIQPFREFADGTVVLEAWGTVFCWG